MIKEDYSYLLYDIIRNKKTAVIGAGPSLEKIQKRDEIDADVIISADGATNYLVRKGIIPDIVVTDLDGITVFPKESIYVVLAHGNNICKLYKVKEIDKVIGTSQVAPFGRLKLFGGFTDGDRGIVLARFFQASKIKLYGMDFDSNYIGKFSKPWFVQNVPISAIKREKLKIAKNIAEYILE
ncbi:DUF115 domain-containing protein [Acidianus sulfidivorans JP7]|uniref:6-hydroxymethyl-7,8-dihydropterin pyrophosphokinase n=2 Tax=Acidianus TaxID=12914 RepID=A0A2U9IQ83_9CREN|nr:DUF115 domain-containing protein [Acidianus sulfidivorans JP7]